jgi:TrmH family RNA methyltransferase
VRGSHRERAAITSRRHPAVARFREARRASAGVMLLDGAHLVIEALDAGIELTEVAIAEDVADTEEVSALRRRVPHAQLVGASVIEAMSPAKSPSGVVALARRPGDGTARMFDPPSPLVVIVADVQDPGNFGAILRSAEAGGASGVIATVGGADPFGWKALRGAMGSAFRLPLARLDTAEAAIVLARAHRLRIVAAVGGGATPISDADLAGPLALMVGGEGKGLESSLLDAADLQVTIPMTHPVESLNVAVATALLVYEARRQRGGGTVGRR